jgi:hypothetical protein
MSKTELPFCRLDQGFADDPKIQRLLVQRPQAIGYYIAALADTTKRCADTRGDWPLGFVDENILRYKLHADQDSITLLEELGMLQPADGGWHISGFEKWQDTRVDIQAKRQALAERKRKSRTNTNLTKANEADEVDETNEASTADAGPSEPSSTRDTNVTETHVTPMSHECHSDTHVTSTTVTPKSRPIRKKKEEGRTKKPSPDGEGGATRTRTRDPEPDTQPQARSESELIDLWEPTPACQALADELAANGLPTVDITALAARFRLKLHARGLDAYRLRPTLESLDYGFRTWIEPEARDPDGLHVTTPESAADTAPDGPHRHDAFCEHVGKILRTSTFLRNLPEGMDRERVRQTLANLLNQGVSQAEAVQQTIHGVTETDPLEQIA